MVTHARYTNGHCYPDTLSAVARSIERERESVLLVHVLQSFSAASRVRSCVECE